MVATNHSCQDMRHWARARWACCSIAGESGVATVVEAEAGMQAAIEAGRAAGGAAGAEARAGRADPSKRGAAAAGVGDAGRAGLQCAGGRLRIVGGGGRMRDGRVGDIGQSRCPDVCCTQPKGRRQIAGTVRGSGRWYSRRRDGRVSGRRRLLGRKRAARRRLWTA